MISANHPHTKHGPHHAVRTRVRRLRWTAFALVTVSYMLAFFHRVAPAATCTGQL